MSSHQVSMASWACLVVLSGGWRAAQQPADPESLFREAVSAQQRGDDAEAVRKYTELLNRHPEAVPVRINLGMTLAHMRRFDEALEQYRAALAADPGNQQASFNLALALKDKGDLAHAIEFLTPLHSAEPGNARLAMLLGDCDLRAAHFGEAVAVLSPLEASYPHDLDLKWMLGSALIHTGQSAQGVALVEQVAIKANSAEAYLLAGQTRLERSEYDLARRDAEAALRSNSKLAGVQTLYGMVLQYAGQFNNAQEALQRALEQDPDDFNAHLYLGAILYFQRDLKNAKIHLDRALKLKPGAPRARYELALVAKSEGRLGAALQEFEAVARDDPEWLEPHVELTALYYRLERPHDGEREHEIVDRLMAAHQQPAALPR